MLEDPWVGQDGGTGGNRVSNHKESIEVIWGIGQCRAHCRTEVRGRRVEMQGGDPTKKSSEQSQKGIEKICPLKSKCQNDLQIMADWVTRGSYAIIMRLGCFGTSKRKSYVRASCAMAHGINNGFLVRGLSDHARHLKCCRRWNSRNLRWS